MAWTRELADALRVAAVRVKSDEYQWTEASRCNCGMLCQVVTGMNSKTLRDAMIKLEWYGAWSILSERAICSQTGEPVNAIAARLLDSGISRRDICDLELLGNVEILKRAGLTFSSCEYQSRQDVARYMLAWADLIDEQLGPREPVPVEVVPTSVESVAV